MASLPLALRQNRRMFASGATVMVAVMGLSVMAAAYDGIPTADLELNDGGVWVTKSSDLLVGHLNYPSRILDGAARVLPGEFDILQQGDDVIVVDSAQSTLAPVDPATFTLLDEVSLPGGSDVRLGGDTLGILGAGQVFAITVDHLAGTVFDADTALVDVGRGDIAVAAAGDRVFAASARDGELIEIGFDRDDPSGDSSIRSTELTDLADDAVLTVAAVGDEAVAFDEMNGMLYLPDGAPVLIPDGVGAALQESGEAADAAYVATSTALFRQPLSGGDPEKIVDVRAGAATSPLVVNGCAYAVWNGSAEYVRDCPGTDDDVSETIDAGPSATLRLRMNRDVVVLNDTGSGTVWLVDENMLRVDSWEDLIPAPDEDSDEEESDEERPQFELPERSADNHPPTARDDTYGARPGRATILRVTENDSDPDGDLLAASLVGPLPDGYQADPVLGGAAIQLWVPDDAAAPVTFRYRVDDGRGGTDEATVKVAIRQPGTNHAPVQDKVNTAKVEVGSTMTYGSLDGWTDPDGDELFLRNADVDGDDTLNFRSNGVVEYTASSSDIGLKEVALTVSDGTQDADGTLLVDVRPKGTLGPIANADRVTAVAGVPVTVDPIANDLSPTGAQLRLAKHDHVPDATITPNFDAGTFDFVSDRPGVYYVQYLVTDGPHSAPGIVRLDVIEADADEEPPVAARDLALLPVGRDALVDVLANDVDPAGGILVVQSVQVDPDAGISVEVLEHQVVRVTDLAGLDEPLTFTYTVANGRQSAVGEVLVMPVPLPEKLRAPVTADDRATVRAGDVVSIPVLANDSHPDNDVMTLRPELVETDVVDGRRIFVDGDRIRFHAGAEPGTVHATYEVEDTQLNRTAGYVTIQVLPADGAENAAPQPAPIIARAIAGTTVRVPIPLDGIDPDGDSVQLIGVSSLPEKGRVTVENTWLTYDAFPNSAGRDTFTYVVRDHLGAEAESTVTVGIAAPGLDNQAPYAVKDVVVVKPGRHVSVPVTVNDSDPDGDGILIVTNGLTVPDGIDAEVVDGQVLVGAPDESGDYTITYTIEDTYGADAQGVLLVTVDPDAPPQEPVAQDDYVSPLSITSETIGVAVLENDRDPDGTTEDLTVAVADDAAVVDGQALSTPVLDRPQIIRYSVTDIDGLSAQAFVYVPGNDSLVPTLTTTIPVEVLSGESIEIDLADHVKVRPDRTARVSVADTARTTHSDGSTLVKDATTLQYTSSADYYGPDTLGVEVTDGSGPEDPDGLSAYVLIPIEVLPREDQLEVPEEGDDDEDVPENQSPALRSTTLDVAPGEDAVTLDVARLASDPDPGDEERLTFTALSDPPPGLRSAFSGSLLEVSAAADAEPGTNWSLEMRVDDGTSEPTTGTITVRVIASTRPLPVANDDVVDKAPQGRPQQVDVLANDFNPFADQGPLTVLAARVDAGRGTAQVEGERVTVTPDEDFTGTMVVSYRIGDVTGARQRETEGRIRLTVQGRPDAPTTPAITSVQDRTVVLSWTPPSNNGAPITGYTVTSDQGTTHACAATTCTLDALTNDVEYTFTVTATNEVGESDPSPASAVARPDARPDTPARPTLAFGDRSLDIAWVTPHSSGSPVLSYNLEISPAPAKGPIQRTGVTGTSMTWDGLENGVAYQVRVQAVNRAPEPSEWSAYSSTEIPAGVPDAPGRPVASTAPSVGSQSQVSVAWPAPASNNGDAVKRYTVTATGGDGQARSQTVTDTKANFTVGTSTSSYTFTVSADNKAGTSETSAASTPLRAANPPAAPGAVSISATGTAGQFKVTITPGAWNGNTPGDVSWRWSGAGGKSGTVSGASGSGTIVGTINGATNGQSQAVQVWGVSGIAGAGDKKGSNSAKPWGPLGGYTPTAKVDKDQVCFSWDLNGVLNGQAVSGVKYKITGSSETTGAVSASSKCSKAGWSTKRTLTLTLTTEEGKSKTYTAEGTTGKKPVPPKGATVGRTGSNSFVLDYVSFPPGDYVIKCWAVKGYSNAQEGDPGYIGNAGTRAFKESGSITFSCPTVPKNKLSVEIQGIFWTPLITW